MYINYIKRDRSPGSSAPFRSLAAHSARMPLPYRLACLSPIGLYYATHSLLCGCGIVWVGEDCMGVVWIIVANICSDGGTPAWTTAGTTA